MEDIDDASWHQLGLAVTIIMNDVTGMGEAAWQCHAPCWADLKKPPKHHQARAGSKLKPPWADYKKARAEKHGKARAGSKLYESLLAQNSSSFVRSTQLMTLGGCFA
ncbi:hypothetical protein CEK25_013501 [Fusarium fujikuroi]|nr:hypothetical protein CEK25_013501 [Fusarium fujikuroi]